MIEKNVAHVDSQDNTQWKGRDRQTDQSTDKNDRLW